MWAAAGLLPCVTILRSAQRTLRACLSVDDGSKHTGKRQLARGTLCQIYRARDESTAQYSLRKTGHTHDLLTARASRCKRSDCQIDFRFPQGVLDFLGRAFLGGFVRYRNTRQMTQKVLIIGLDGATFDVLNPLMDDGRLPRLKEAVESGASGILHSTVPPITPSAWTTFLTGKQPGSHGIIDFERYDVHTNKLSLNSTRCLDHVRNIWQILSDKGYRVGSVNVPMTYPPIPVNGFMVTGFETPGPAAQFAYPASLKPEILAKWPDPTLKAKWRRKVLGGDKLFAENIDYISRSFHQGAEMTRWCGDKFGWDVLMVVFKLVDNLQHKVWKYIDPRWSDRRPQRCEMSKRCFQQMDVAVGNLLDYAKQHDAITLIVSDHGHGSLDGKVQPNLMLADWGYLKLKGGTAQGATRTRRILDRSRGKTGRFARTGNIAHDLAVDFSQTTACVMHAGMAGFLYINLEGRQPTGIVKPERYEALRDELKARFLDKRCRVTDPSGRTIHPFIEVHKPEELYDCPRKGREWLPDLMLVPHRCLAVVRKIRGRQPVRWLSYRRLEGTHRPEGISIVTGPAIRRGATVEMNMVDCAQTILAMCGCPIPDDMEGRVATEVFETPPDVTSEAASGATCAKSEENDEAYSQEDLAKVTERLADLGYLE